MSNFNDSFTIEIDASRNEISIMLSQQSKPITFMSKPKEMLAIMEFIRLYYFYLLGRNFFILANQYDLKYYLEQRAATPKQ